MKWLYNSMIGYWITLLSISLVIAALIYIYWLKDKL